MSHGVKYGVLAGVIGAAYLFLLQITGLVTNNWMGTLALAIWVAAIVLAHLAYRKANQGVMSYGKGLIIGIVVASISAVIGRVYLYIHLKFISSEMLDYYVDTSAAAMEQYGLGQEAIDLALTGWRFTLSGFVLIGLAVSLALGVILSLIIAAITKKKA
jgi:hypothetical protein